MREVFRPAALLRLALGWLALVCAPLLPDAPSTPVALLNLALLITIISVCSFGVVAQAEALAKRLGDPYGTVILTLSIVAIEVVLISAVLLGPGQHTQIARDSIMAVSMIILNLVIGLALVVLGARGLTNPVNRRGFRAYLWRIVVFGFLAFALPVLIDPEGIYRPFQAAVVSLGAAVLYARFLYVQLGKGHRDFQEVAGAEAVSQEHSHGGAERHARGTAQALPLDIPLRSLLLLITATPIVVLAHNMASLLEVTAQRFELPPSLPGLIIAAIVFLPETITTLKAAGRGETQRVSNLCHGALLSSFGLTIPAVLTIGLMTNQGLVLGESPLNIALFGATCVLTCITFAGKPRVLSGIGHLAIFALFIFGLFAQF